MEQFKERTFCMFKEDNGAGIFTMIYNLGGHLFETLCKYVGRRLPRNVFVWAMYRSF